MFARAVPGQNLFVDEADREEYLRLLGGVVVRFRIRCLAYCLLGNHVHLVFETTEPNLDRAVQALHGDYVSDFNLRHDRFGSLFAHRYGSARAEDREHVCWFVSYVANNPVSHGFSRRAVDWPWGSHTAAAGAAPPPEWLDLDRLYQWFGDLGDDPRANYAGIVERARLSGITALSLVLPPPTLASARSDGY